MTSHKTEFGRADIVNKKKDGGGINNRQDDEPYKDDQVDTYGETVLEHFKKEQLEKRFGIHDKPSITSPSMIVLVTLDQLLIHAYLGLFLFWIYRSSHKRHEFLTSLDPVDPVKPLVRKRNHVLDAIGTHAVLYTTCLAYLLPQANLIRIFLDFANISQVTLWTFALRLSAFVIFSISWSKSQFDTQEEGLDVKTHSVFSYVANLIIVLYLASSSLRMIGYLFPWVFQLRIIGKLLRLLVWEVLIDALGHLTNAFAMVSQISGYYSLLFFTLKDKDVFGYSHKKWDSGIVKSLVALLAAMYTLLAITDLKRHDIVNHSAFITKRQFVQNFLTFKHLYQSDSNGAAFKMPQHLIPKVNVPQRMA